MKQISSLAGQKVGPELLALWEVCELYNCILLNCIQKWNEITYRAALIELYQRSVAKNCILVVPVFENISMDDSSYR